MKGMVKKMKKHKTLLCFLAAVLVLMTVPTPTVHAEEQSAEEEDKTGAPYFYVETADPSVDSFPLKKTDITADINGVIADIHVLQTYANEGTNPLNACYIFPASTKVTVHGMQMQIGNQIVTAQIKEKEEAEEEFEEAKEEGKSASLLSEEQPNVFSMNVANIMPGDTVSIDLHYTELITPSEGTYQFVYPTVVGPRYVSPVIDDCGTREEWTAMPYLPEGTTPDNAYDIHVNLSAGVPITELSSSSHKIDIQWDENTKASISLADPSDYAGNRDFILDYKMTSQDISTGLMLNTGEKENFFMLMVQPPERFDAKDIPPREYIFVLDISGSMSGFPLNTAKELIKNLVSNLKETDTFNLILFSGASSQMAERSLPATKENIDKAIKIIDNQEGSGGTELAPALEEAIAIPASEDVSRNIVIITDGYIYGENDIFDLIRANADKADFFPFGIGKSVNRYLIEGIAKTGQGEPFIVTDETEASETAQQFKTYIQSPVLTNIEVSFDGFDAYDVEPTILPTLYAQKPIVLLGKWRGEPQGTVQITGQNGSGDYTQTISVAEMLAPDTNAEADALTASATAVSLDSDALSYLWAQKRIERLTNYGLNKNNPDIKDELTQLGLDYSILTPYTSFIAVIDTVRNPDGNGTDVDQPLPLPLEVSNFALGGYLLGSEPTDILMIVVLLLIMLLQIPNLKRIGNILRKRTKA